MKDPIEQKVIEWEKLGDDSCRETNLKILHLHARLFTNYEPMLRPAYPNFLTRLNDWMENISNSDDQKLLFEMVPNMFYVGKDELNILYREAYNTIFGHWLIDQIQLNILDENANRLLEQAIIETWFCPLTDSLRINQFYHINNIPGRDDYRPDWRSIWKMGDIEKVKTYINEKGIKRLVLLEDFIGNGGQVSQAVTLAATELGNLPLLIIPLIICPKGVENSEILQKKYENVSIKSVISLSNDCFINPDIKLNRNPLFSKINEFAIRSYLQVADTDILNEGIDPYGPFGWRQTGGLIVMYTNTPNNSLPLIHNESRTWKPLFKRHKRV